jgi:hypothetical protein
MERLFPYPERPLPLLEVIGSDYQRKGVIDR